MERFFWHKACVVISITFNNSTMNPNANPLETNHSALLNKRADKKSINIKWNSGLYFKVGLIVSLLLSWIAIESHWGLKPDVAVYDPGKHIVDNIIPTEFIVETVTVEKVTKPIEPPKRQKLQPVSTFTEVDNFTKTQENKVASTEVNPDTPVIAPVAPAPTKKEPANKLIMTVQKVPVYPGCESLTTNEELRNCLSDKVNAFISRKFDVDKYSEKYLGTKNRIDVMFTINSEGIITNVEARSPHPDLAKEAASVVRKLPKMIPGKHENQPVNVQMSVPVIFNVEN